MLDNKIIISLKNEWEKYYKSYQTFSKKNGNNQNNVYDFFDYLPNILKVQTTMLVCVLFIKMMLSLSKTLFYGSSFSSASNSINDIFFEKLDFLDINNIYFWLILFSPMILFFIIAIFIFIKDIKNSIINLDNYLKKKKNKYLPSYDILKINNFLNDCIFNKTIPIKDNYHKQLNEDCEKLRIKLLNNFNLNIYQLFIWKIIQEYHNSNLKKHYLYIEQERKLDGIIRLINLMTFSNDKINSGELLTPFYSSKCNLTYFDIVTDKSVKFTDIKNQNENIIKKYEEQLKNIKQ